MPCGCFEKRKRLRSALALDWGGGGGRGGEGKSLFTIILLLSRGKGKKENIRYLVCTCFTASTARLQEGRRERKGEGRGRKITRHNFFPSHIRLVAAKYERKELFWRMEKDSGRKFFAKWREEKEGNKNETCCRDLLTLGFTLAYLKERGRSSSRRSPLTFPHFFASSQSLKRGEEKKKDSGSSLHEFGSFEFRSIH